MVGVIQTVEELKSTLNNPHLSQKEKRKIRNSVSITQISNLCGGETISVKEQDFESRID